MNRTDDQLNIYAILTNTNYCLPEAGRLTLNVFKFFAPTYEYTCTYKTVKICQQQRFTKLKYNLFIHRYIVYIHVYYTK